MNLQAICRFREHDDPLPAGPYAVSKRLAEEGLLELAAGSSLEIVIIRPPLVYGPGVRREFPDPLEGRRPRHTFAAGQR